MSEGCLLCGAELEYLPAAEEMQCVFCGRTFESTARCRNGHYICDECHANPAESSIRRIVLQTRSKNPYAIAEEMFASPAVHMHGPEHHFLVASALLAACGNAGLDIDRESALNAVIARGRKVPGGFCGLAGCCGAAVSAGIFASVVQKTTPLSAKPWASGIQLTADSLEAVAKLGGPRCCKRNTYAVLQTAVAFCAEELNIILERPDTITGWHSGKNTECKKTDCPFYPR